MGSQYIYRQVADGILRRIASGELGPGAQIASVAELREEYGVSHMTVLRTFRYLNQRGVIVKHPRRGYTVSHQYTEKMRKLPLIGLLVRGFNIRGADSYYNDLIAGVQREALGGGYGMLFSPAASQLLYSEELHDFSAILADAAAMAPLVRGFIVDSRVNDRTLNILATEFGKPVVLVDRDTEVPVHRFCMEVRESNRKLVEFLRRLGYEALVLLGGGSRDWKIMAHAEFYADMASEMPVKIIGNTTLLSRTEILRRLLDAVAEFGPLRTVVIAHSDGTADAVIKLLHEAGHEVPEFVGMVGWIGHFRGISGIATLQIDSDKIGGAAVRKLLTGDLEHPEVHYIDPEFILGSTI